MNTLISIIFFMVIGIGMLVYVIIVTETRELPQFKELANSTNTTISPKSILITQELFNTLVYGKAFLQAPYGTVQTNFMKNKKQLLINGIDFCSTGTGSSMRPMFWDEHTICFTKFSKLPKDVNVGDIVAVGTDTNNIDFIHIVDAKYDKYVITMGINNNGRTETIEYEDIVGIGELVLWTKK